MECIICQDEKKSNFVEIYECSHKYHECCISQWKKNCPLCRAKLKSVNKFTYYKVNCYNYEVTPTKYLETFREECIVKGHTVEISKPYGVVINCLTCGYNQCYNWLK